MLSQAWLWGRHHSVLAWGQSCHGAMLRRWAKSGFLLGLLCISAWGYAQEKPFFEEDIPTQKMVMSRHRSRPKVQQHQPLAQEPAYQSPMLNTHGSPASALIIPEAVTAAENATAPVTAVAEAEAKPAASEDAINQASAALDFLSMNPYDIVPEQGQKLSANAAAVPALASMPTDKQKKPEVSDAYTFNRITQWVNEVSMNMFTFSGDHLNRDRHNASKFFSPEAWETVDQFLFHRAESPFLQLKQHKGNSRAMTMDWPIALHTDTSKRGKIWWVKVPVTAIIKDKASLKRAFFEVKLGVLPVQENGQRTFIAEEVVMKQVHLQQRKHVRGNRNAR